MPSRTSSIKLRTDSVSRPAASDSEAAIPAGEYEWAACESLRTANAPLATPTPTRSTRSMAPSLRSLESSRRARRRGSPRTPAVGSAPTPLCAPLLQGLAHLTLLVRPAPGRGRAPQAVPEGRHLDQRIGGRRGNHGREVGDIRGHRLDVSGHRVELGELVVHPIKRR